MVTEPVKSSEPDRPHEPIVASVPVGPRPAVPAPHPSNRRWGIGGVILLLVAVAVYFLIPLVHEALTTVSTDDAYVNGHVTFVAPRVVGQVAKVFVDDNNRVRTGDLLVQLDDKPYRVIVALKNAALAGAKADLLAARTKVRGYAGQIRGARWKLQHAIEEVHNEVAGLRAKVATLATRQAALVRAEADFKRGETLLQKATISREDFDQRQEAYQVALAQVKAALEDVYESRVALGLPAVPENNAPLEQVPADLDQTASSVREALSALFQSAAQLGIEPSSYQLTPNQTIAEFMQRDPKGNIDQIYNHLLSEAPPVKQAEAALDQAQADLDQAKLNLGYCNVYAEIDGVVTRRNVNPGNNVQVGQALMALRSVREVWVDANFKETQLSELRIGQRADLYVDMYGKRRVFKGRVTGFTMGTGSTLAILPAENATGNFVKVVQRLPVRIDLTEPNPDDTPLFVGLSIMPYVYFKEPATGPDAGNFLQPVVPDLPTDPIRLQPATLPTNPPDKPAAAPPTPAGATPRPPSPAGAPSPPSGTAPQAPGTGDGNTVGKVKDAP